jgi:hypothetical protein
MISVYAHSLIGDYMIFHRRVIRLFFFVYFRKRGFKRNHFRSIISPIEIEVSESKYLEKRIVEFKNIINPTLIPIKDFIRIGSQFDGGYVVPKIAIKRSSFLVSGGISNNNEFEIALAKKGFVGVQIDYSISAPPEAHTNLFFVKKILGEEISLKQATRYFSKLDGGILKLDIEGSEYKVISDFNDFSRFNLIIIEFHYLNQIIDPKFYRNLKRSLLKIQKTHSLVYMSPNNCCGYSIIGGQPIPKIIEFTWLKTNLVNKYKSNASKSNYRSLSSPNKPFKAKLDISNLFPNW